MNSQIRNALLLEYYETLRRAWGPQHWWPARTRFEVIVGAYLTQNSSWKNVERALQNLRKGGLLTVKGTREVPLGRLEELIRPSGYFRQKATRLKTFVAYLDHKHGGSLAHMFDQPTAKLRQELLALHGVGPETADSILLYAGDHPVFVVDAYTRRILKRHDILAENRSYDEARTLFETAFANGRGGTQVATSPEEAEKSPGSVRPTTHPPSAVSTRTRPPVVQAYNEMHALIVAVGKDHCLKSNPQCEGCPLQKFLPKPGLPQD
jgi:endonuclease-3 related protein